MGWLRTIGTVAHQTLAKAWQDRVLGLSAEAAFWQLLSLPPLLLAVLASVGYTARWMGPSTLDRLENQIIRLVGELVSPEVIREVVRPVVDEVLRNGRGEIATVSLLIALWAGSSATATFVNTVTIAYGQRDLRGAVASRLVSLGLYLCFLAVSLVAAPLLLLGPNLVVVALPEGWQDNAGVAIKVLYWPVTAAVVFTGLSAFYHFATPVRLRWRRAAPGAALALVLFMLFSWTLRGYVAAVFSRLLIFSTLAAPVLTLLYFYTIALAVLLGAELNGTLERRWPRGRRPPLSRFVGAMSRLVRRLRHSPVGSES